MKILTKITFKEFQNHKKFIFNHSTKNLKAWKADILVLENLKIQKIIMNRQKKWFKGVLAQIFLEKHQSLKSLTPPKQAVSSKKWMTHSKIQKIHF